MAKPNATGFIGLAQIDGVWWFTSPDGEPMLSLGVNHIEPHLWMAPYNLAHTLRRYGADFTLEDGRFNPHGMAAKRWIDRQAQVCQRLGFNTFAKHTHRAIPSSLYRDQIYYVASFNTAPLSRWQAAKGEASLPDVFSAAFERHLRETVSRVCAEHRDSQNLLGYLYTDIPQWESDQGPGSSENDVMVFPWLNAILRMGEYAPGKRAWIAHLREYFGEAASAARVWGIPVSRAYGIDWDYLARLDRWFRPVERERARCIAGAFMGKIAERWYKLHHGAIRQHDPHHLILGDKTLIGMFRDWLLPALARYVDVVLIQSYNHFAQDRDILDWLHAETGKPLLNGDGSFGYANPQQQRFKVKGMGSGSRGAADAAKAYRDYLAATAAQPYMLGWHHCGYLQQWDGAERGDVNSNENGFLDPFENEYSLWTRAIMAANREAHGQHARSLADASSG